MNLRHPKPLKALLPVLAMLKIGFSWVVPQKMNDVYTIPRGGSRVFKRGAKDYVHTEHISSPSWRGSRARLWALEVLVFDALSFAEIFLYKTGYKNKTKHSLLRLGVWRGGGGAVAPALDPPLIPCTGT